MSCRRSDTMIFERNSINIRAISAERSAFLSIIDRRGSKEYNKLKIRRFRDMSEKVRRENGIIWTFSEGDCDYYVGCRHRLCEAQFAGKDAQGLRFF